MARYNQPTKGSTNWDEPLNQNFDDLGIDVLNEAATFDDLPEPTGMRSSNGISRRYLVRDEQTIYRDAGSEWQAVLSAGQATDGSGGMAGGVVQHGGSWADAARKIENNNYVVLRGNISHDGSAMARIAPQEHKYVDARGAVIQCRGKLVRRTDSPGSGFYDGSFNWVGGQFEGSQSKGEIPFHLSDALGDHIFPHRITDCEVGVAVDNRTEWSEIFSVGFRGRDNLCALAIVGVNHKDGVAGSYPVGCSLSDTPTGQGGTHSFRDIYVDLWASPRQPDNGWEKSYGIWTDNAKPYEGDFRRVSVNVDTNVVGMRMHYNFEAARIHFWSETPGRKQNGTAIVVDEMHRSPNWIGGHIVTAGGTTKISGKESKPLGMEMAEKSRTGGDRFWNRFEVDGEEVMCWLNEGSGNYRQQYQNNYRVIYNRNGSVTKPTIDIGGNGVGLYTSGGDLYAVDANDNSTKLT